MGILLSDEEIGGEGLLVFITSEYECRNIAKAQLKRVVEWGDEICLEHQETSFKSKLFKRWMCEECRQELLKEIE